MATNLTRKEQKAKWFALSKEAFVDDLLDAKPKDYQERNRFYQQTSILISYPLQLISILAGSYLLFQIAHSCPTSGGTGQSGCLVDSSIIAVIIDFAAVAQYQ